MFKKILIRVSIVILALVAWCGLGLLTARVTAQSSLGQSQYPTALDTPANLFQTANYVSSSLSRQCGPTDTVIYLNGSASQFPASGGAVSIANNGGPPEIVYYSSTTSSTLTGCLRGQDGSVAVSHAQGQGVVLNIAQAHVD
ncbi:MAG TPA: hypothetical protein VI756_23630 [Blastocatellia bacterium]